MVDFCAAAIICYENKGSRRERRLMGVFSGHLCVFYLWFVVGLWFSHRVVVDSVLGISLTLPPCPRYAIGVVICCLFNLYCFNFLRVVAFVVVLLYLYICMKRVRLLICCPSIISGLICCIAM